MEKSCLVDSLKRENKELYKQIGELKMKLDLPGSPTDGLEVGSPEDYGDAPLIYESPDGGKTIYQRRAGDYENKESVVDSSQMELFKK
jgi:hypothetical protein